MVTRQGAPCLPALRAEFKQFDLATRCAQQPQLCGGDVRVMDHQRVELMQRLALPRWLNDHEATMIAHAATAAFIAEECD